MLGNGNSALSNRTSVGIRNLTRVTPGTSKKIAKKGAPDGDGKIDRVVREEASNKMLLELAEEELEDATEEGLSQPPGHSDALRHVEGDAFRKDAKGNPIPPTWGDVDQGNLGDAWLLASCAAVAHTQPAKLMKRVTRNEDGSFLVRLGEEHMRVTPDFPTEGYADPIPNGQRDTLWVALIEKAYALHEAGSYANLENGTAGRALEMLTGSASRRTALTELTNLDRLHGTLRDAKREGRGVVVRTREMNVSSPLHGEHHYAVLDTCERNGERFVKLYNPWGTKNNSRPLESMIVEINLDTLRKDCEALYVAGA